MPILTSFPNDYNHFTARQQRMESALAGYRLNLPPNAQGRSYVDGLLIRGRKAIIGKKADWFCQAAIIVGTIYVLYLLMQAISFYASVK